MSTPKTKRQGPPKGRTLDPDRVVVLDLRLNDGQVTAINSLLSTGLWGNTASEVARRLLDDGLLRHAANPKLS